MDPVQRLLALERFGIKLGLEAMDVLCDALGSPHTRWPSLHIAGTNGKGSVAAMSDAVLRAAGLRTGRYTSPHLVRLEERFALDGVPVDPETMRGAAGDVLAAIDRLVERGALARPPTFFEAATAVAFLLFARAGVDAAVIEVGLGGRFDATNVIRPHAAAITSIALDHQQHLGDTLAAIAREKAGVAKRSVPLVVGPCAPEAEAAIARAAQEAGAPVVRAMDGVRCDTAVERGRVTLALETPRRVYPAVTLGLAGRHQAVNAIVAVRALEAYEQAAGLTLDPAVVAAGLAAVRWPGRLEWIALDSGRRLLIDAAHNPAGATALARYLDDAGLAPLPIVVAVMQDKDAPGLLAPLAPRAAPLIVTEAPTPRTRPACDLAAVARRLVRDVVVEPDPIAAIGRALTRADTAAAAGSIFLIGAVRAHLLERGAV